MRSVDKLDPADLWGGNRAVLVGTTLVQSGNGLRETEIIVILNGSESARFSNWTGEITAQVSISGRNQGNFETITTHLPRSIETGCTFVLKETDDHHRIFLVSIAMR